MKINAEFALFTWSFFKKMFLYTIFPGCEGVSWLSFVLGVIVVGCCCSCAMCLGSCLGIVVVVTVFVMAMVFEIRSVLWCLIWCLALF